MLMFPYLFPPCNCWPTASQRAYGLARGLADLGWTPVVITRRLPVGGCRCGAGREDVAESDSEQDFEVVRVPTKKWLGPPFPNVIERLAGFVMGGSNNWAFQARRAAQWYVARTSVDLVWTTSGPIGSVRLGRFIQRTLSVPWVADLRDSAWRALVMVVGGTGVKAWFLRKRALLLARPLRRADAVVHVTTSEAQADAALIRRPSDVIPSAFDEEAWSRIHAATRPRASSEGTITVLFAGHAYPGRAGYATFFEGVRAYAESPQGSIQPVRIEYLGPTFDIFRVEAERTSLSDALIDRGVVSLTPSREAMHDADALLLVTAPENYGGAPGGKLYEYLAACRPILAVTGLDPFVADVLKRTGHGLCLETADAVTVALAQLAAGSLATPPWPSPALEEFTWPARSRQLAEVFDRLRPLGTAELLRREARPA